MNRLRWILAAAIAAYACHLAVFHTTPIDRALPLLGAAATLLAAVSYPAVMLAVPMLVLAEIAIPDETLRLLAFGTILATAVFCAAFRGRASVVVAIAAIALLRWIPPGEVMIGREAILLGIALLIVFVLGATPFAVAVATIVALVTPAVPLRTLALPLIVLVVCAAARTFGMPRLELRWLSAAALALVTLFFAWSGLVARAFPYVLRAAAPERERVVIRQALPPRAAATFDVPPNAAALVVSGANVAHLRRGAPLGRIEPGGAVVRIGDAADWGFLRREQFYGAHNPLPRDPAGAIRGYGYAAWIDGAGRVALPRGASSIRVSADASLPSDASLQVEGFELAPQ